MSEAPDIPCAGSKKPGAVAGKFLYRWFSLLVLLYGLLGFLFYLFLFLTNHKGMSAVLPFRTLSKESLWVWLFVFAVLHLVAFSSGVLLLICNKVYGLILFFVGLPAILLANAIINNEVNYASWTVFGIIGISLFFLRRGLNFIR